MQQPDEILLAEYSIEKSDQAFETANNLLNMDLQAAQNRIYYAIFYLVLALGYLEGFKTGKHHQLMGWINKKYIFQEKIFEPKLNKIYSQLIIDRDNFDYIVAMKPTRESVLDNMQNAKYFIEKVKPYVINKLDEAKRNL